MTTALAAMAVRAHSIRRARRTRHAHWHVDAERPHHLSAEADAMVQARVAIDELLDLPDAGRATHQLAHVSHVRTGPERNADGHGPLEQVVVTVDADGLDRPARLAVTFRHPTVPCSQLPTLTCADTGRRIDDLAALGAHLTRLGAHTEQLPTPEPDDEEATP